MFEQQRLETTACTNPGWIARVDELATRLMIEGSESAATRATAIGELQSISHGLQQAGPETAARIANSLLSETEADSEKGIAHLLKSGLTELRRSLEVEEQGRSAAAPMSLADDAELIADFLVEAREHLSQIESQMLVLERDPFAMEVIHAVFRAFHTIKGLAGFLDFQGVQAVAHEVETLLDLARNARLTVHSAIVDVVLESGDFLLSELAAIEDSLNNNTPLAAATNHVLLLKIRHLAVPQPAAEASTSAPSGIPANASLAETFSMSLQSQATCDEMETPQFSGASLPVLPLERPDSEGGDSAIATKPETGPSPLAEHVVRSAAAAVQTREPAKTPDASSVRVETAKLDHLMNMVGEIVIAQSLIRHNHLLATTADSRLMGDLSQLARVTAEVQRATMSMRMVPVGQLFQRVERVIRDLSRKAGKQVVLETSGAETEIDKTVAEELSDPLLHMVRNSIDHGIEPAAERVKNGKTPEARIRLSAYHQGGQVIIAISDDGRGLNSERIRKKAEDRQLISPGTQLTDEEIYQLIFEPGFSTAEQITDISGRGVGMDVVRRNVEKLRGRIETESSPGQGTRFLLKLPLTLAIIDGLVIEIGSERYIIPLSGVREIFRPHAENLFTVQGRDEMMLVREELLPVVRLSERLGIVARAVNPSDGLMVVLESENRCFCLMVDDLLGKQEVVIKSLGEVFKDAPGVSGCAVLGDGRVGLILDTDGIYRGRRR